MQHDSDACDTRPSEVGAVAEPSVKPCHCAWCDWVRRNSKHVVEPAPGHTYKQPKEHHMESTKQTLLAIAIQHKDRLRSTPIAELSDDDFNLLCLLAEAHIA